LTLMVGYEKMTASFFLKKLKQGMYLNRQFCKWWSPTKLVQNRLKVHIGCKYYTGVLHLQETAPTAQLWLNQPQPTTTMVYQYLSTPPLSQHIF